MVSWRVSYPTSPSASGMPIPIAPVANRLRSERFRLKAEFQPQLLFSLAFISLHTAFAPGFRGDSPTRPATNLKKTDQVTEDKLD